MIDTRRVSRRVSLPVALLPLAAVLWIACRDAGRITGPQDDGSLLVVSDPLVAPPGTLGGLGTVRNVVDAATAHVAYVSLPPGTLGDATSATVRNVGRNAQLTVAVMDGGFDPVAIVAEAGDTISVDAPGVADGALLVVVPVRRPPQVVRTYPLHGKRDVPLNTRIFVVFSEPLDRQSVNASTVQLLRADVVVSGRIEIDDMGLTITFIPDTPLLAGTDYALVVSAEVRDLQGDHLQSTFWAPFTTSSSSATVQRIAFFDWGAMYVINSDGTGYQRVVADEVGTPFSVTHPAWSPDGSKIAYAATRSGNWDIYVVNADGSNVTRLTTDPAIDDSPDWSPDGKQIVFSSTRGDGWRDIYVMDVDGTNVKRLTRDPPSDFHPAWSPDGRKIAFVSDRFGGGDHEICSMNADGSGITRLTFDPESNGLPRWSPDGSLIAYDRIEPQGTGAVYVMAANGAGEKRLTNGGGAPAWSPDGKFIVYSDGSLYVIHADGTGKRQLSAVPAYEPAWSPR